MKPTPQNDAVQRLADQLSAVCQKNAGRDEAERVSLVQEALDEALALAPADQADTLAASLRERLVKEARGRSERLQSLESQLESLRAELESARETASKAASAEKARDAELDGLRSELERAKAAASSASAESHEHDAELIALRETASKAESRLATLADEKDALAGEMADIVATKNAAVAERDALRAEKDALTTEITALGKEKNELAAQSDSLTADQRTLQARCKSAEEQVASLRDQVDALSKSATSPATPPPPPPGATPAPSGDDPLRGTLLTRMRQGLRAIANGESVDPASLELPSDVQRLFELMERLLRFSLELDRGVQAYLMELQVGPAMDTVQVRGYHRQVQQRFLDCLDDKDGSIEGLGEVLDRNRRFLILLNEAYRASIPRGSSELLAMLTPDEVLKRSKGKGLLKIKNYEGAFKELTKLHEDLVGLPPSEMLTRFFTEPFQDELRRRVEP